MKRVLGWLLVGLVMAAPLVACAWTNGIAVTLAIIGIVALMAGTAYLGFWLIAQED